MEHLTVDEIIAFVSFSELNEKTLAAASKVNSHILNCTACREKVKAFITVHEKIADAALNAPQKEIEKNTQKHM